MNDNYTAPRRVSVLPLAVLQVAASLLLALSVRTGFLHIGVFMSAVTAAMFAVQILASNNYMYFISAAISACGAYLIGGVFSAAMAFFAVPAGVLTAVMLKKKSSKISLVVALELAFAILFGATFLAGYAADGNELSVAAVVAYFGNIVDTLKETVLKNLGEDEEVILTLMKLFETEDKAVFEAMFGAMFDEFKLLLPALLISVMGVIAYLTAFFFKLGTRLANCELLLPDPRWETLPSRISAVLYSLAYVGYTMISMLGLFSSLSGGLYLVFIVCNSIVIILSPLMLLMGAKWLFSLRNRGMITALFVIGLLFMPSLAIMILAFFGVREIFLRRDRLKEEERKNTHEI